MTGSYLSGGTGPLPSAATQPTHAQIVMSTYVCAIRSSSSQPREIEEFLYQHPAIADVQVIGVPDARYGEELCAWVRCKEGRSTTGDELREWCRGKISAYKIPRYWRFVDAFPMTVTGKVQKFKMRETSITELGLEEVASTRTA